MPERMSLTKLKSVADTLSGREKALLALDFKAKHDPYLDPDKDFSAEIDVIHSSKIDSNADVWEYNFVAVICNTLADIFDIWRAYLVDTYRLKVQVTFLSAIARYEYFIRSALENLGKAEKSMEVDFARWDLESVSFTSAENCRLDRKWITNSWKTLVARGETLLEKAAACRALVESVKADVLEGKQVNVLEKEIVEEHKEAVKDLLGSFDYGSTIMVVSSEKRLKDISKFKEEAKAQCPKIPPEPTEKAMRGVAKTFNHFLHQNLKKTTLQDIERFLSRISILDMLK